MKRTFLPVLGMLLPLLAHPVAAQDLPPGDPAAGKRIFVRCMACHSVGEGATNKIGPVLNDLFGRQPGSIADFKYSEAMKTFGQSHVWTPELVAQFVEAPPKLVPGTIMVFPGLRAAQERADLVAYLATFDADGPEASSTSQ